MQDFIGEDWYEEREREAADLESERAHAALTAEWAWCPACQQPTLPGRRGVCLFCLGETEPLPSRAKQTGSPGLATTRAPQPPGSLTRGGGARANTEGEAA